MESQNLKCVNINVVLFADKNVRASIAVIRSLMRFEDVNILLVFKNRGPFNFVNFTRYRNLKRYYIGNNNKTNFLLELRAKVGDLIVLPMGEAMIQELLVDKELLDKCGVKIPCGDLNSYKQLSDKKKFIDLCSEFSIDIPKEISNIPFQYEYNMVVKPKSLSKGVGVLRYPLLIENENSFVAMNKLDLDESKHIYQHYIKGPAYYYCVYCKKGEVKVDFIQKNTLQQAGGKSVYKALPDNLPEELIIKTKQLLRKVEWDGVAMFEYKKDLKEDRYYAIECNPRLWGPLQITIDNGVDFPALIIGLEPEAYCHEKFGYLWKNGALESWFISKKTKTGKQTWGESGCAIYIDIWFRKDTWLYYFVEPIELVMKNLKKLFFK